MKPKTRPAVFPESTHPAIAAAIKKGQQILCEVWDEQKSGHHQQWVVAVLPPTHEYPYLIEPGSIYKHAEPIYEDTNECIPMYQTRPIDRDGCDLVIKSALENDQAILCEVWDNHQGDTEQAWIFDYYFTGDAGFYRGHVAKTQRVCSYWKYARPIPNKTTIIIEGQTIEITSETLEKIKSLVGETPNG